jgi:hypothetical protein
MRRLLWVIAVMAVQALCMSAAAFAQESEIDCSAFLKNPDGSWTVIKKAYIPVQKVRVVEGTVFLPGQTFLGEDMAERLAKACPNQPVAVPDTPEQAQPGQLPPGTPSPQGAQVHQTPRLSLGRYADANGTIDVQRLSCGHLAEATPEETELLLAWYSGWYNGIAKKRGINLARVRFAIRSVADYCRANPDKRLVQVMELMLK